VAVDFLLAQFGLLDEIKESKKCISRAPPVGDRDVSNNLLVETVVSWLRDDGARTNA
jgi:hypothetical protein